MSRIGCKSSTRNGLRQISGQLQSSTRRSFAISLVRAQDDHSNTTERNSQNPDPTSPVRLTGSRNRAYWAHSAGGHGLDSNASHRSGVNDLPPNPNNPRDGFARKRQAQGLHEWRKGNSGAQPQSSPFGVPQSTFEPAEEAVAVDASRAAILASTRNSYDTRRHRSKQLRNDRNYQETEGSNDAPRAPAAQSMPKDTSPTAPLPNQVGMFLDGQPLSFSSILLRDLCECPLCLDPSTKQKLFSTADIPSGIKTSAVAQDAESISLVWENDVPGYEEGHTTVLDIENIRALRDSEGARSASSHYQPGKQLIWDAKQYRQLEDFEYQDYMHDETALHRALQQLHTYGMLFLRGVPENEKSVSTIAERIGPVKNTFYGYTWDVRSVPEAKNVAYTSQDLGFHMDLLYMAQPPHLQFLHCIRSSAAGGASLFADSYKAAADLFSLDIEAFFDLASLPASFHYNHPSSHLYQHRHHTVQMRDFDPRFTNFNEFARGYRDTNKARTKHNTAVEIAQEFQQREQKIEDYIENVAWSPPFQAPFQFEFKKFGPSANRLETTNVKITRWHDAAQKFSKLIHREIDMYERMMRPGQCVIFDNRRVLHARRAFEAGDAGKERWLRGAYLDWDPFWSKMRVLGAKFGRREEGADVGGLIEETRR